MAGYSGISDQQRKGRRGTVPTAVRESRVNSGPPGWGSAIPGQRERTGDPFLGL